MIVSNLAGSAVSSNATLNVAPLTNLVISAFDSGWYDSTGYHSAGNSNYLAGENSSAAYPPYRNWFAFNIPAYEGTIASAQLRLYTYEISSPSGFEVYEL